MIFSLFSSNLCLIPLTYCLKVCSVCSIVVLRFSLSVLTANSSLKGNSETRSKVIFVPFLRPAPLTTCAPLRRSHTLDLVASSTTAASSSASFLD